MRTFDLTSTQRVAEVTWKGKTVALHNFTRLYVTVDGDVAEFGVREPDSDYVTLVEVDLNKNFEDASLKDAKSVLEFIQKHNSVLVDGYDLDGFANTFEELLRLANLVDIKG